MMASGKKAAVKIFSSLVAQSYALHNIDNIKDGCSSMCHSHIYCFTID